MDYPVITNYQIDESQAEFINDNELRELLEDLISTFKEENIKVRKLLIEISDEPFTAPVMYYLTLAFPHNFPAPEPDKATSKAILDNMGRILSEVLDTEFYISGWSFFHDTLDLDIEIS